tara:strand:+ start:9047 stop:9481 length:435 start_codon:yes stop_codon:yes gene_type:complete
MSDLVEKNDDPAILVSGALTSMHLMAAADRYLSEEEVSLIADLLYKVTGVEVGPDEIIASSREIDEKSTGGSIFWQSAFEPYRNLSLSSRGIILKSAMMVALSDGEFHDEEKRTLGDLAGWLGLTPDEYVSVLEQVRDETPGDA